MLNLGDTIADDDLISALNILVGVLVMWPYFSKFRAKESPLINFAYGVVSYSLICKGYS
jgi:hypothetical protein